MRGLLDRALGALVGIALTIGELVEDALDAWGDDE